MVRVFGELNDRPKKPEPTKPNAQTRFCQIGLYVEALARTLELVGKYRQNHASTI